MAWRAQGEKTPRTPPEEKMNVESDSFEMDLIKYTGNATGDIEKLFVKKPRVRDSYARRRTLKAGTYEESLEPMEVLGFLDDVRTRIVGMCAWRPERRDRLYVSGGSGSRGFLCLPVERASRLADGERRRYAISISGTLKKSGIEICVSWESGVFTDRNPVRGRVLFGFTLRDSDMGLSDFEKECEELMSIALGH